VDKGKKNMFENFSFFLLTPWLQRPQSSWEELLPGQMEKAQNLMRFQGDDRKQNSEQQRQGLVDAILKSRNQALQPR
jgi:hypothetical protein